MRNLTKKRVALFIVLCVSIILFAIISICAFSNILSAENFIVLSAKNDDSSSLSVYNNKTKNNSYTDILNFSKNETQDNDESRKNDNVGGELIGIRLKTQGVLIVGTEEVETAQGYKNPAYEAGIRTGDTLISVNGEEINNNFELSELIKASEGKKLEIIIKRDNETIKTSLQPVKSVLTDIYKCGIWIRDSTGGIGTLTFSDPKNSVIVSLGHGIYDVDTKSIMKIESGLLVNAQINGITKGVKGNAGEIRGSIGNSILGEVVDNNEKGLYSKGIIYNTSTENLLPVAYKNEIKTGDAQIISTISNNGKKLYDVEIQKINMNKETKNMIIKVTDEELIEQTGGIIQGMSGSPIIQDGKLVGAVTHVMVNDPTTGYGIFIENMLETSQSVAEEKTLKDAS